MKVLQVNCVYRQGSTGKITYDLHRGLLDAGAASVVCYGRGGRAREPGVYKTCPEWYSKFNHALTMVTGVMYGGCLFSTGRLLSIIRKERPDVVHLQCINGYFVNIYRLVDWLKRHRVKTVLTLHAEFMYTANCGHALDCERWRTGCGACPRRRSETKSLLLDGTAVSWRRMKRAFDGFDDGLIVTSVSPWLKERAERSPILAGKRHRVVLNGVDTGVFHPYDTADLRQKHNCEEKKVIFHATPAFSADPDHIKGGRYVLELAERMPDVRFLVAGSCVEEIRPPENMVLLGKISDQALLARYYSMADVTLLTSKRETFSMVTAESLCCGTPVVGFRAGGPEQIALPGHSCFVENGDIEALKAGVRRFLQRRADARLPDLAAARYSTEEMVREYLDSYAALMGERE